MGRVTLLDQAEKTLHAAAAALPEPSSESDGGDISEGRHFQQDVAEITIRADGADVTLTGPVYLCLYFDGAWFKAGALNNGQDIAVGDTGWAERVVDVGIADKAALFAAGVAGGTVTAKIHFVETIG